MGSLTLHPLTFKEAKRFIGQHHRHHRPPTGGLFAIGVALGEAVVGCAIVGRPLARLLDDGWTVEITRCCTDGSRNACSILYRACARAAMAMGYRRVITYTRPEEGGGSLRGAGFRLVAERAGGGTWNRRARPRVDLEPNQAKWRWEA
jgi:hypothetical protein